MDYSVTRDLSTIRVALPRRMERSQSCRSAQCVVADSLATAWKRVRQAALDCITQSLDNAPSMLLRWLLTIAILVLPLSAARVQAGNECRGLTLHTCRQAQAEGQDLAEAILADGVTRVHALHIGRGARPELEALLLVLRDRGITVDLEILSDWSLNRGTPGVSAADDGPFVRAWAAQDAPGIPIEIQYEPRVEEPPLKLGERVRQELGLVRGQYRSFFSYVRSPARLLREQTDPTVRMLRLSNFVVRTVASTASFLVASGQPLSGEGLAASAAPLLVNLVFSFLYEYSPGENLSYKTQAQRIDWDTGRFRPSLGFLSALSAAQGLLQRVAIILAGALPYSLAGLHSTGGAIDLQSILGAVGVTLGGLAIGVPIQAMLARSRDNDQAKVINDNPAQNTEVQVKFLKRYLGTSLVLGALSGLGKPISTFVGHTPWVKYALGGVIGVAASGAWIWKRHQDAKAPPPTPAEACRTYLVPAVADPSAKLLADPA